MKSPALYPLRFKPIYQYRLWGGRRLAHILSTPLPGVDPIGEAWLLSDRDDHPSVVADGPLQGRTLGQVIEQSPEPLLGKWAGRYPRFPLLLKFLDARDTLSVQVHPSDRQTRYLPRGESGKTEAWIVLEAEADGRIYAGLKPGATPATLRQAIADGTLADHLASFAPKPGDGVYIPAGTVHSLGRVVVFEVQQNSDVTFRLFDWNHVDAKTGEHRPLQIDEAIACIDYEQGAILPVARVVEEGQPIVREPLFHGAHFGVTRVSGKLPFTVGARETPRVLVGLAGSGQVDYAGLHYPIGKGDVLLLPAEVGACPCHAPDGITLLEISLPEAA